jgi:Arc/MetJ-type ribon-helix-helix transcriptional regulator
MTERITFSMPEQMAADINAQLSYGDNRSEWIRDAIREKLDREGGRDDHPENAREDENQPRRTAAETNDVALTPESVAAHVGDAVGLTNQRERSLAAALRYLRDEREAQTTEIVAAAYAAVPTYASEASWRSNLWNNVGTALRETDAVELTNKSRGRWRWVGED